MLLGAFPFEHSTAAADEQRAFNEVHFEQIRIHWTENERNKEIVKRMSPECKDLLDRIFRVQEKERITIEQIKQHPWYTEPLPAKFDTAMKEIERQQAGLEKENKLARVRYVLAHNDTFRCRVAVLVCPCLDTQCSIFCVRLLAYPFRHAVLCGIEFRFEITSLCLVQASAGAESQQAAIKQIVQCACMTRAANIQNAHLEDKEVFLTRMQAKVQTGKVELPADVVNNHDLKAP